MPQLRSYVVRYDSGFAPNPFFGVCTLATCRPDIRARAKEADWIIGTGSADRRIKRGGHLVFAMRVTGALTFQQYWNHPQFQAKKPNLRGARMHACGDNIYRFEHGKWEQLDSFHSDDDGSANQHHVEHDTKTDRVLLSEDFFYFGGEGPQIPKKFQDICVKGRGEKVFDDSALIAAFVHWIRSRNESGQIGRPLDWVLGVWK